MIFQDCAGEEPSEDWYSPHILQIFHEWHQSKELPAFFQGEAPIAT